MQLSLSPSVLSLTLIVIDFSFHPSKVIENILETMAVIQLGHSWIAETCTRIE